MKPIRTVLPCASSRWAPTTAAAVPAATEAILPSRTTTEPRSITPPLPSMIRALTMTRFCAAAPRAATSSASRPNTTVMDFMAVIGLADGESAFVVQIELAGDDLVGPVGGLLQAAERKEVHAR